MPTFCTPTSIRTPNSAPMRPDLVATVGSVAAVEYYVLQQLGTAGSYCAGGTCTSVTGISSVGVYYTGPTTPASMCTTIGQAAKANVVRLTV